tara:strand:+ start:445 stop:633 length:189 start_codon:yes stop_codon:yes gene_type:complete
LWLNQWRQQEAEEFALRAYPGLIVQDSLLTLYKWSVVYANARVRAATAYVNFLSAKAKGHAT